MLLWVGETTLFGETGWAEQKWLCSRCPCVTLPLSSPPCQLPHAGTACPGCCPQPSKGNGAWPAPQQGHRGHHSPRAPSAAPSVWQGSDSMTVPPQGLWWLCWCAVKPLEVVASQSVFAIVPGMRVSCRVKGHSEYLLWVFFLSGTGTAHLHSTNVLPDALRVRNMLLECFQLETHWHLLESLIASLKARDTQPSTALLCCGSAYSWVSVKLESFTELTAFSEKPKYCKISSSSAYLL